MKDTGLWQPGRSLVSRREIQELGHVNNARASESVEGEASVPGVTRRSLNFPWPCLHSPVTGSVTLCTLWASSHARCCWSKWTICILMP